MKCKDYGDEICDHMNKLEEQNERFNMGMYTELILKVEVEKKLPQEIEEILLYLFEDGDLRDLPEKLPDHEFFRCKNWEFIGKSASYYHVPKVFRMYKSGYIFTRCDLKNYENEIEEFIDWIDPYITNNSGTVIGWTWYEEDKEPTLLRKK